MKKFGSIEQFKAENGYDFDDGWYPRVTRIVEMKAKPALLKFYADVGFDAAKKIAERSASEGTAVHEIAEKMLLGDIPSTVDESIRPSISAFWDFLQKKDIKADGEHIELLVKNDEHRYAGTLDALVEMDGKFGVLDIKTSSGIYRDYNLQTSAYVDALQKKFPNLTHRWILRIDQQQTCRRCGAKRRMKGGRESIKRAFGGRKSFGFNGHYDIIAHCKNNEHDWMAPLGEIELKELPLNWRADFEAFLGAKKLWEWEFADWLDKLGYGNNQQSLL